MSIVTKLEEFYGLPIDQAIQKHHWELNKPMIEISRETGLIRQSIMHVCKVRGIKFRNTRQHFDTHQAPTGENHWAWGKTKETSGAYRSHSIKMTLNNPTRNERVLRRRARTIGRTYRNNPLEQESEMRTILRRLSIPFRAQYPIGRYIIDFYLPCIKVVLEVDTKLHWGKERADKARIRDEYLLNLGYPTVRVCKSKLKDPGFDESLRAILSTFARRNDDT